MRRKEHMRADLICLGYTDEGIHSFIDASVKWLGAGHRLINHDPKVLDMVRVGWETKEAERIALFHLLIDAKIINVKPLLKSKLGKSILRKNEA